MRIRTRRLDKLAIKLYNGVQLIEVSDRESPLKLLFIDSVVGEENSWSNVAPVKADHCGVKGLRGFFHQVMNVGHREKWLLVQGVLFSLTGG